LQERWHLNMLEVVVLTLGAAVVNGIGEELLWRDALLRLTAGTADRQANAVVTCALSFGLAHRHGSPGGWAGMVAASLFGLLAGCLRLRWGLVAAVLVHVSADLVVLYTVISE
jgi:membrane protease YdiL (CAAX protease family)